MTVSESRQVQLGRLFVRLADNLVSDFDVVELLNDLINSCSELLDVAAAGLMLVDLHDQLRVMASSSREARLLELFELQKSEGPCVDCYRTGMSVSVLLDDEQERRWPEFAPVLRSRGLGPAYALPLRLRDRTIGALNLFRFPDQPLPDDDLQIAQAMADVATITILQHRATEAGQRLAIQLQTALNSRVAIEQAKGVIAQRTGFTVDEAFQLLRRHARSRHLALTDLAIDIANGRIDPGIVSLDQAIGLSDTAGTERDDFQSP
jgi:GAF domain-containing protein